jgi:uncharacterized protein YcbX
MNRPRLAAIHRYPLKGFGPQSLSQTGLAAGRGIPFDRAWAIRNGTQPVESAGGWTPCQAFVRLTRQPHLPKFAVQFDDGSSRLTLYRAGGEWLSIDVRDESSIRQANQQLDQWFPLSETQAFDTPRLVAASSTTGYWDHPDATISIINMQTVEQLADADYALNPIRFRGNLLIDHLPAWEELQWPGSSIRIGDIELEVLRPIDRCVATSVNPATGLVDMNIPARLARHAGHVFCGVYARVVNAGTLRVGDSIEQLSRRAGLMRRAAEPSTAPPVALWPRTGIVTKIVRESEDVHSFWICDPALTDGAAVTIRAGQHIRLHAVGQASAWRSYTVATCTDDGRYRISVKRESPTGVSAWLHAQVKAGATLLFSGPFGTFHLPIALDRPVIFVSAGIGITPLRAMFEVPSQRTPTPTLDSLGTSRERHCLVARGGCDG